MLHVQRLAAHSLRSKHMRHSGADSASPKSTDAGPPSALNVVERNVRALVKHAAEQERAKSTADRFASAISGFVGSMKFVYLNAVALALWAAFDLGLIAGADDFGLSLGRLANIASVEAIFLATFVLVAQNRMADQEEIRNHLDVQVSLLNEHETTHILRLVAAMAEKMGLPEARDPAIQELIRDVEPLHMIEQIAVSSDAKDEQGGPENPASALQ